MMPRYLAMEKLGEPGFWIAVAIGLSPLLATGAVLLWVQS
jgi:hypothetical protein